MVWTSASPDASLGRVVMQAVQLDLFEERTVRLARGRGALRAFDLSSAREELAACLLRYPEDREAREGLALACRLGDRLAELEVEHGDPVTALLLLEPEVGGATGEGWHRRLAQEAERRHGCGCDVAGAPAGLHWLLGGDLEAAERSLRDTLGGRPGDARVRAYLADVLFCRGQVRQARQEYIRAFLADPEAVDLDRLADPDVVALPAIAETEYEIPGPYLDWVAAVGTLEGVFPVPAATFHGIDTGTDAHPIDDSPGRSFYRYLLEERSARSHKERVAARRRMKQLSPSLLSVYMGRLR